MVTVVPGHHVFSPPHRQFAKKAFVDYLAFQFVDLAAAETSDEDDSFRVGGGAHEAAAG